MVLETSQFKIFSASAGSGKTYSLTKEYLLLLLKDASPIKFRQILAITFTNKAVGEMKSRILDSLFEFGKDKQSTDRGSLFNEICQELGFSEQQLQQRAKIVLQHILHNYSFFEISTIDKFNHKIIKTFARDLQLSQNFEVELDTDLLLHEAVGRLLDRASGDDDLTQALIAFSLEKIDEDKSWDISRDLAEIGKLLFQEGHSNHLDSLKSKTLGDFKQVQRQISKQIKELEASAIKKADEVLVEIEKQGFLHEDFPRKTLPNHFKKVVNGEFNTRALYANKLEDSLQEGRILKTADKRDTTQLCQFVFDKFSGIKKILFQRSYLKNIYGNIVPLTLLNEIAREIKSIELDREVIPISALNTLLSKQVRNQPVPFIYERMGEKYRHYFIDEFQDTSQVQWENLVPLIGNALESVNEKNEHGSLFLVGDVKQAIYRWRGGRAEQLLDLINQKDQPFSIRPELFSLDTNWRSYDEIIQFNNRFFNVVAPFLQNEDYRKLFLQGCQQKPTAKKGGYVQLSFLGDEVENKDAAYCEQVLQTIQEVRQKDYRYSDICILVRKNDHGSLLANFLSEHQVPIISSESLLLKASPTVAFLISLLKVVENPNDQESAYELLLYLSRNKPDVHHFIASHLNQIEELLSEACGFSIQELKSRSVLAILERAIVQFDLSHQSHAYLTFLLDEVLIVEKREGPGVHAFLKYWEQKKDKLSIAAPEHIDAIKIMTIHKSKGLEFPIVIFPFANARIDTSGRGKKSWLPATDSEKELGLDEFLINTKKEMSQYNDVASSVFLEEEEKTELDAMNVLYVALTRAEKGLFVFSESGKAVSSPDQCSSYADLFRYFLQHQGLEQQDTYAFGALPSGMENSSDGSLKSSHIPFVSRGKGDQGFVISTRLGSLWDEEQQKAMEHGNLIHHVLSQIETVGDIPKVLEQLQENGELPKASYEFVSQKIKEVVRHPQLSAYFTSEFQVLNEQEILMEDGKILRPDRIVLKGSEATIMDYKTGKPSPSHKAQIMEYADALKTMGYTLGHIIIVYIDHEIKPLFL
ncbi:UvrD-helicase domain-containing protein [Flagellimonas myxillae]|uniref:UvrD-helicase domain-containing protein n=1 Tax=Flagellimonas myxillae TaxID=2942214 RepID=UPI00201F2FE8|nr:UvrD-helicase domain-containing protein [Muricauda myxillae]MCL6267343.1 UvrD-helicase domain-containing protein [Muricauda myxillae]